MRQINLVIALTLSLFGFCNLSAQDSPSNSLSKIYLKPYGGFIGIQDMKMQFVTDSKTTDLNVSSGFGFTTGISLGYNISKRFTAEVGWEYKKNNISISSNDITSNGDYASNFIYVNGIYKLPTYGYFTPYIGIGGSFIQEIDLDFGTGENGSFSQEGDIGVQGLVGLDFQFAERWSMNWEAKYVSFNKLNLLNESNNDQLKNLKYNPFIFNIGIKYQF